MKFKNPWQSNKEKDKNGSYLKYEEGEVVPVESKRTNYPPFLDEDEEVKKFKDIQREDEARRHVELMKNKDKQESDKNATSSNNSPSNPDSNGPKKSINPSFIVKAVWLVIIGGLVYYSIPMFQYFASETPDLTTVEKTVDDAKNAIDGTAEQVNEVTQDVKEEADKVADTISEGSGLVDAAKESMGMSQNTDKSIAQLTENQWLTFINSTQNQKQENLISLQQYTNAYVNGQIGHSKYRLQVKGITNSLERLQEQVAKTTKGQNMSKVGNVVNVLDTELNHLNSMSVSLSSVSGDAIPTVFNEEVKIQNELTNQYKNSFKALLDVYGKSYTEQNGSIVYQ